MYVVTRDKGNECNNFIMDKKRNSTYSNTIKVVVYLNVGMDEFNAYCKHYFQKAYWYAKTLKWVLKCSSNTKGDEKGKH